MSKQLRKNNLCIEYIIAQQGKSKHRRNLSNGRKPNIMNKVWNRILQCVYQVMEDFQEIPPDFHDNQDEGEALAVKT